MAVARAAGPRESPRRPPAVPNSWAGDPASRIWSHRECATPASSPRTQRAPPKLSANKAAGMLLQHHAAATGHRSIALIEALLISRSINSGTNFARLLRPAASRRGPVAIASCRVTATFFTRAPKTQISCFRGSVKHGYAGFGSPGRGTSPNPFACMARCTLFWKLESSPLMIMTTLSAMMSHRVSTQDRSVLAKSLST